MNPSTLAARLTSDPELLARVSRLCEPSLPPGVVDAASAVAIVSPLLLGRETEALVAVALDRRCRPIDVAILTTGSDGGTIVDARQVLRWVLTRKRPAVGFMLAHNHPSGDPAPSWEDITSTQAVAAAGKVVGLQLMDHIIVTDGGAWVSLATRGEL